MEFNSGFKGLKDFIQKRVWHVCSISRQKIDFFLHIFLFLSFFISPMFSHFHISTF